MLEAFLRHRREVVTRRTVYELARRANVPMCWKVLRLRLQTLIR